MDETPKRIKAQAFDKGLIAFRCMGEMVIHVEMVFRKRLDRERLAKAVELALDAEPILGCRLVTDVWRVYWERVHPAMRNALSIVSTEEEYESFKLAPHDLGTTVSFKVCLWSAPDGDRLLAKIAHEAADGGGSKEAVAVLAEIYTKLGTEPYFVPPVNRGSRGAWQALKRIPWYAYPRILWNALIQSLNHLIYRPAFMLALGSERSGRHFYAVRHIPKERLSRAVARYKPSGATINDLVLTAFSRAVMLEGGWDGSTNMRTLYTADFRKRFVPGGRAEAVCNMSGFEFINFGKQVGSTPEETLALVTARSTARKKSYPGVNDAFSGGLTFLYLFPSRWSSWLVDRFIKASIQTRFLMNGITNMGPIEKSSVTFDDPPQAAWLIVPPLIPPLLAFGLSGYDGGITVSCGSYRAAMTPERVERLFDRMEMEMPGLDSCV